MVRQVFCVHCDANDSFSEQCKRFSSVEMELISGLNKGWSKHSTFFQTLHFSAWIMTQFCIFEWIHLSILLVYYISFFRYCFLFFLWGGKLFLYLISLINESKLLRHVYICVKVMTLPFWMLAFKSFYSSPARTQILQSLSFTKWKLLSRVQLFVNPWTIACQAPLSMEFSWQENWSGWPFPSPGCKASVCSLVLCLVTTKIWSDRH